MNKNESIFIITGWAIDFANETMPKEIYIKSGNKVARAEFGISRPYVKEFISAIYEKSGFIFKLDKAFFSKNQNIEFYMVSSDSTGLFMYEPLIINME